MTSATDSDSSVSISSEQEWKRKKMHKKLKKKSEKKIKKLKKSRHNEKKRARKEKINELTEEDDIQVLKTQPSPSKFEKEVSNSVNADAFGPVLPPHLLNTNKDTQKNLPLLIGPTIPREFFETLDPLNSCLPEQSIEKNVSTVQEDNNFQSCYGPLPISNELEMTSTQLELEQRALLLKMAAIDGVSAPTSNQNVREEWMLELPDVGLKGGLAALNNLKRGFHQGKEKPDFRDRSSWTKTPNSGQEKQKPKSSKEELELQAQALYEKQRDAEQEVMAKKHRKKHKREQSLVDIHQRKLRKEEKKKAKELTKSGSKPERRPFCREVDLKLNKIDRNQTKQIVDKAKILNTKFSSGHSKYL